MRSERCEISARRLACAFTRPRFNKLAILTLYQDVRVMGLYCLTPAHRTKVAISIWLFWAAHYVSLPIRTQFIERGCSTKQ